MNKSQKAAIVIGGIFSGCTSIISPSQASSDIQNKREISEIIQKLDHANALEINEDGQVVLAPSLIEELKAAGLLSVENARAGEWTPGK